MQSKIVLTASASLFSLAARSSAVAVKREKVDFAGSDK